MSFTIIGSCSICGGSVVVPTIWFGIYPPVPKCQDCGATKKESAGPVIPMEPSKDSPEKRISWKLEYSASPLDQIMKQDARIPEDFVESGAYDPFPFRHQSGRSD